MRPHVWQGFNPKIAGFELLSAPATRGIQKLHGSRFQAKSSSGFLVQGLQTPCFHLIKTSSSVLEMWKRGGLESQWKSWLGTHLPLQPVSTVALPPADWVILLIPKDWCFECCFVYFSKFLHGLKRQGWLLVMEVSRGKVVALPGRGKVSQ